MNGTHKHIDPELVTRLSNKYFSHTAKTIELERGDYLLRQNQINRRLFLVVDGLIAGFLNSGSGKRHEIFRSEHKMFVGVHSFFSQSFEAYADVVALKKSRLTYIDYNTFTKEERHTLVEDFAPVVVHELSARQVFTKDIMLEKEVALKKLYQSEKFATLGQMAAGLAHELNNAIGVMNGNSEWIAQEIYTYFRHNEIETVFQYFDKGFKQGQLLSSDQVRENKRTLARRLKLNQNTARKLAKIGFDEKKALELTNTSSHEEMVDRMYQFWEMGVAIHDILLASKHAVHVLKSIKQLSITGQERTELNINDTITEALTLLKNKTRQIAINLNCNAVPLILANHGELVQVWVNIIKNACESMNNIKTEFPALSIKTTSKQNTVTVTISNNGPEIPKHIQDKIFQPNFTTKKGGLSFGLGLGLSIVQRLIDSYNGRIILHSEPGNTSFKIKLPIK